MSSETLSREQIVRAAIEILDAEGLEGLSMRRLGARLGSGATSIYWWVGSKDELIDIAVDEVFGEIQLPDPGPGEAGWRGAAITMAYGLRAVILGHPWLASLVGTRPVTGPKALRYLEHSMKIYESAGFSGDDLDRAVGTVAAFVQGMTMGQASWKAMLARQGIEERAYVTDVISRVQEAAVGLPRVRARYAEAAGRDLNLARAQAFDFGLEAVLDGLAARLPRKQEAAVTRGATSATSVPEAR